MASREKYGPFRPTVKGKEEREKSIRNDTPAVFKIDAYTFPVYARKKGYPELLWQGASEAMNDLYNSDDLGKKAVCEHDRAILKHSQRQGVDPDMVRAMMDAKMQEGINWD